MRLRYRSLFGKRSIHRFPPGVAVAHPGLTIFRNHPGWEREAVCRDVPCPSKPDPLRVLVLDAVFDRLSQRSQAERLADDEAMERQREHKRVPLGLLQHLLELIDDHISELAAGMIAVH